MSGIIYFGKALSYKRSSPIRDYLNRIKKDLESEGYKIEIKLNTRKTVHSSFIRFDDILFASGLSPHRHEKFSVKIEVDTHPPSGSILKTTVIRRYLTMQLQHHDQSSMFAGKLHAILVRKYTKGRDIYDLFWYLNDRSWPEPNLTLLNNALVQTAWKGSILTIHNWCDKVKKKLQTLDWKAVISDVEPFLENREIELFTQDNIINQL